MFDKMRKLACGIFDSVEGGVDEDALVYYSFPYSHSQSSLGSIGGQMMTTFQLNVFVNQISGTAVVFAGGHYQYISRDNMDKLVLNSGLNIHRWRSI